jgi:hypothetical protein
MKKMIARGLSHFWRTGNGEQARQRRVHSVSSEAAQIPHHVTGFMAKPNTKCYTRGTITQQIATQSKESLKDGPNVALRAVTAP